MRRSAAQKKRKVCIGDLGDRITLQRRTLTEPLFTTDAEFTEAFTEPTPRWARIRTTAGKTAFNAATGLDVGITHEILVRYDAAITTEIWVLLESGQRLDIVLLENLDEQDDFLRLFCTERGSQDLAAAEV